MRYYLIADDSDTLTGMRLAGIEGELAQSRHEVEACVNSVCNDDGLAVMLISEKCAALLPERISELKLSAHRPLVVVIPGSGGSERGTDSITRLIREAIGVKI